MIIKYKCSYCDEIKCKKDIHLFIIGSTELNHPLIKIVCKDKQCIEYYKEDQDD